MYEVLGNPYDCVLKYNTNICTDLEVGTSKC